MAKTAKEFIEKMENINAIIDKDQKGPNDYMHPGLGYGIAEAFTGDGLYVKAEIVAQSVIDIVRALSSFGVDVDEDHGIGGSHITILWDKNSQGREADVMNLLNDAPLIPQQGLIKYLRVFDGEDGSRYLVLIIESEWASLQHDKWIKAGFEHSFPNYAPHITVSKDDPILDEEGFQDTIQRINAGLQSMPIYVKFTGEIVDDAKPE